MITKYEIYCIGKTFMNFDAIELTANVMAISYWAAKKHGCNKIVIKKRTFRKDDHGIMTDDVIAEINI